MKVYRFVILLHETPMGNHWDVMLETDSALATWAFPPQNMTQTSFVCLAKRLPDHRKHYLDYEGEVTGNRGTVSRIDAGTYHQQSAVQFVLHGKIFTGMLTIDETTLSFTPCSFS